MKWFGKVDAFFDKWSLVHFSSGVVLGSAAEAKFGWFASGNWWMHFIWLFVAFPCWEIFETYLEKKDPDTFRGRTEIWYNRWISDGVMDTLGGIVGIWVVF